MWNSGLITIGALVIRIGFWGVLSYYIYIYMYVYIYIVRNQKICRDLNESNMVWGIL